jgi:hypothetical protein
VVEFEFQVDFFVYTYIIDDIYTLLLFDENSTGAWLSKKLLCKWRSACVSQCCMYKYL